MENLILLAPWALGLALFVVLTVAGWILGGD